jgi:hypothetical protein
MQERVEVKVLEEVGIIDRIGKFQCRLFKLNLILSITNLHLKRKVWTYPCRQLGRSSVERIGLWSGIDARTHGLRDGLAMSDRLFGTILAILEATMMDMRDMSSSYGRGWLLVRFSRGTSTGIQIGGGGLLYSPLPSCQHFQNEEGHQ